ncbi:MAG: hypothetical protein EXR31_02950 [Betaproteobacteria bacterium]|nr:hypothetical protein [Betaproteobacteria bacterium]
MNVREVCRSVRDSRADRNRGSVGVAIVVDPRRPDLASRDGEGQMPPFKLCIRSIVWCVFAAALVNVGVSTPALAQKNLVIAQGAGPTNLDPLKEQAGPMMSVWMLLYDGLTRRTDDGRIEPALSTSWRALSDTLWEFKLREGVRFHNGEPFTAEAVKFTLDRILEKSRGSQALSRLPQLMQVDVVDPLTVRIHTKGPAPTLPNGLGWAFIVPPKYTQEKGDAHAAQNPVGTGPFKFVRWRQAELIEMVKHPEYFGSKPKIDRVTVRQIPDDSTRMASLLSGETHIAVQIPPDLVKTVASHPGSQVLSVGALMGIVLEFDTLRGPLVNKKVRQAINYGIDKESLVRDLLAGQGQPLQGQVLTPGAFGFNSQLKPYPYDPERARQLLREAGVPPGQTLALSTPVGRYIGDRELAIAVAGQLEKIGLKINVVPKEWGVFIKELRADQLGPMFLIGWYNYGDASFALSHFTSRSTFGIYQKHQEFDELVQQGQAQLDPKARGLAYQRATELMREEAPAAFLLQLPAIYGVSKRVTGFKPRPDERWNLLDVDLAK